MKTALVRQPRVRPGVRNPGRVRKIAYVFGGAVVIAGFLSLPLTSTHLFPSRPGQSAVVAPPMPAPDPPVVKAEVPERPVAQQPAPEPPQPRALPEPDRPALIALPAPPSPPLVQNIPPIVIGPKVLVDPPRQAIAPRTGNAATKRDLRPAPVAVRATPLIPPTEVPTVVSGPPLSPREPLPLQTELTTEPQAESVNAPPGRHG